MDLFTFLLCKKKGGGGGGGLTYTLSADTVNKQIVLTPSEGDAQAITVPYATDASTVNGKDVPELENGKIPATYLPSYVDDVLEYEDLAHFPAEGEVGKIYIALDTSLIYRWGGSVYAEINQSLALGETEATAYRGDRGKIAYDHSQSAHAPSNAEANQNAFSNITVGDTTIEADSKTDTFTLEAGNNITLTPDASTDKVTITATDTTYSDATTSVSGLMSGSDKTKLNGIATGAEVNQNAFSNVKIGSTTVAADSKTDTLELEAGDNIELTPDSTNDKITISGIPVTKTIRDVSIASFSDGGNAPIPSLTASIVPVQAGSGDPSPTNVRPISGWSGCEVVDDAVYGGFIDWNQLINVSGFPSGELYGITYVNNDSNFTINGTATAAVYLNIVPNFQNLLNNNHIYLFCPNISDTSQPIAMTDSYNGQIQIKNSAIVKKSSWNTFWLAYYIPNGSTITNVVITPQVYDLTQLFGSTKADEIYAMEQAEAGSGVAYFKSLFYKDYYPYNSGEITNVSAVNGDTDKYRKYTIPFTDSQGQSVEVFSGSVDVVNGGEQPNPLKKVVFDGSNDEDWRHYGGNRVTVAVDDFTSPASGVTANILCDKLKTITKSQQGGTEYVISGSDEGYHQFMVNVGISDITELRTWLSNNPITVAYELTTPTTFYTQPTSIKSLDGVNNLWASTGPLREVTYRTQAYGDFIAQKDLPDAISDIKTLKLDENQILIGDGSFDKIGIFMDNYYDENLDITFSTEVTPQEIYLTSQPAESVNQTTIISGDRTEYQTSLLSGTEVINTVNAIGMEVNVKENGSITHGIKIVSGDIRLLGSDTWDGTNISLKNALEAIQNNLYIANYNKTASLSSGSNSVALDMTGYTYNGSDIINVYVDGLYKVNNTDYTITVNDSTGVASINYTAAAAGTMAIQVIKPKIGFTALTDNNGDNVTDSNGNSIDI